MSDIPVEKRLELVHQVRSQYHKNQSDLMTREQILYGRSTYRENAGRDTSQYQETTEEEGIFKDNTFGIRMALAGILLLTFILLDKTGKGFAGMTTDELAQTIASDYGTIVDTWAEAVNEP